MQKTSFYFLLILSLAATPAFAQDSVKVESQFPNKADKYPVLFAAQNAKTQISATGFLKGKYLESTPANFFGHAINGRIAGLLITQSSGEPGNDAVGYNLRGRAPIVYVDGVPRASTLINPEQIESITVLKDALSTNMMGIRGMNGAILVTTKNGAGLKNTFNVNFKAQAGVQSPLKVREFLGAADYATLYNEALTNDGRPAIYTQAAIDAYKNQTNPYTNPDVNWNDKLLEKNAAFSRYTLGAEGGGSFGNYNISLDYLDQQGLFKQDAANAYSTNSAFKRYIFRTNLNANITDKVSVFVNLFGRIRNTNAPGAGVETILEAIKLTPNNAYPVYNPNSSLGGNINYQNNLYAQSVFTGYSKRNLRDGFADAGFKADLSNVLKGWWVKGLISFNTATDQTIDRTKNFEVFSMSVGTANDTTYQRYGTKTNQANTSTIDVNSHQVYTQLFTGISRIFGNNGVDVLLTANIDKTITNSELPNTFKTVAAQVQYNYKEKYLAEVSTAYSGNNRFIEGQQYGFFPAAGLGWNLHKEDFLQNVKFVNSLKLRTSYGLTGNANPGYFLYQENYAGGGSYIFGATPGSNAGLAVTTLPSIRTYEEGTKFNAGLDAEFLNNKLFFSFDYYKHNLSKMLISRGSSSAMLGLAYPLENLGKYEYSGIEIEAGYANQVGKKFSYNISANLSTQQSNLVYDDLPAMPYSWMNRTRLPVGQFRGFVADGFVTAAGQGPVMEGYQSKPGDIKYKDLNGDGVINLNDRTAIGSTKPVVFYGANINAKYSGLYVSLLFQGIGNRQTLLTGNDSWEFQNNGRAQAYPHHLNRWTPATAATASYPRLSVGTNPNNHVSSTFWLQDVSFFRLKNAEIGYEFTGGILQKAKLKSVRVFANGLNLFTSSKFTRFDAEMPGENYSIQRVINGGVSITF